MSAALLSLEGVHTHIGAYHILHGVDLDIPDGELTVLLGRNGAGKSTTLRSIMGLWQASAGTIRFDNNQIGGAGVRARTPDIVHRGIAYVPEDMGIFNDLTVAENMLLAARGARRMADIDGDRLKWLFELFPALKKFWLYPAGALSGGQKQMLAIARAIIEPQRLLLVDEPCKGLAPAIVQNLVDAFNELKRARTTILLVEQNFGFASQIGDSAAIMDNGRIAHRSSMADLVADKATQERLLGFSTGTGH